MNNYRQGHSGITWTAGALYSAAEYDEYVKELESATKVEGEAGHQAGRRGT